jgi:hypothetical protein
MGSNGKKDWRQRAAALASVTFAVTASSVPPNIAPDATVTANSEHNAQYLARFATDGKIPAAGSQDDTERAWCVQGATHRAGADFTLNWTNAVNVAEVVYWARTAWYAEEGWKDYEVWLDEAKAPAARGQLAMGHGRRRVCAR